MFRKAPAERIAGITGGALAFDGKSQFAEIPASVSGLDVGEEDFSIEFWIRTRDSERTRNIIDKRDTTPRGYLIYIRRGRIGMQVASDTYRSDVIAESQPVAGGQWHHVAAVVRRLPPGPPEIFIDGSLRSAAGRNVPLDDLDNKTPMWIGRHHANTYVSRDDIYFKGAVDELAFYRRALGPDEIRTLFRAGAAGKCRPSR